MRQICFGDENGDKLHGFEGFLEIGKKVIAGVDYVFPIALTFGGILTIYIIAVVFVLTMGSYEKQLMLTEGRALLRTTMDEEAPGLLINKLIN